MCRLPTHLIIGPYFASRLISTVHLSTTLATVPSVPTQDIVNTRSLSSSVSVYSDWSVLVVYLLEPNVNGLWDVVASTASVQFDW